ncbi:MAG: UDP-3-O-(3-hydroxymyristoyl)glucosamine N-acyltransferase [Rickettsiales bacterium]|nr:UDP-3-O-(3-hydroxymyristoyl)glucosamine N-acyltransferase [Rickettsiales bacterium]
MRTQFFDKKFEFLTIAQIAEITGSIIYNATDNNQKIYDVATLDKANKDQISFLNSGQYFSKFEVSNAAACFVEEKYIAKAPKGIALLVHKNPYFAYAMLAASFYQEKTIEFPDSGLIHKTAIIGEKTRIAPNAYIGKNVKIGKNSFVGPSASIMDNVVIGDNCIINAGVVISYAIIGNNCIFLNGVKIGQDGFGFAHNQGVNHKIIQLGIVEIGNNVEIGANSCVDRGALENTIIGDGTKIDNLVQIGHNVRIGKGTVMAGCSAVAGSAVIGNFVQIGGKSSIGGHLTIYDGAKVAGMSGVARDVEAMQAVAGIPAIPIRDWHKINAKLLKLIKLKNDSAV